MNRLTVEQGGGFYDAVRTAYDVSLFDLFAKSFLVLPAGYVLADEVFVVHGGLPRPGVSLADLESLPWKENTTMPQSLGEKGNAFNDMLWSDPRTENGWACSCRGMGIAFGPDHTKDFLKREKLCKVVRSHQLPGDNSGVEKQHDGLAMTVFSASNYGDDVGNTAAVVSFKKENGSVTETTSEYFAPKLPEIA